MVDVIPLVQRKYTRIRAESFGGGRGGEEIKLVPYLVHFKRDPISIVYLSLFTNASSTSASSYKRAMQATPFAVASQEFHLQPVVNAAVFAAIFVTRQFYLKSSKASAGVV